MEGSKQGHIPGLEAKARGSDYKPKSNLMVFPSSLGKIPLATVWSMAMQAMGSSGSWDQLGGCCRHMAMVVAGSGRERGVKGTSSKHTGT